MSIPAEFEFDPRRLRLVEILREKSYRRRRVILASGRESDFYVDGRQTTLNAEGAWLIGNLVFESLNLEARGIGGLVVGADPISASVAVVSFMRDRLIHAFLVRKEAKGHGTGRLVEGRENLPDGTPVCVIEDTCTSGSSLLAAVDRCELEGLRIVQCLTIVDRDEGAVEAIAARGWHLDVLVRRQELER